MEQLGGSSSPDAIRDQVSDDRTESITVVLLRDASSAEKPGRLSSQHALPVKSLAVFLSHKLIACATNSQRILRYARRDGLVKLTDVSLARVPERQELDRSQISATMPARRRCDGLRGDVHGTAAR